MQPAVALFLSVISALRSTNKCSRWLRPVARPIQAILSVEAELSEPGVPCTKSSLSWEMAPYMATIGINRGRVRGLQYQKVHE